MKREDPHHPPTPNTHTLRAVQAHKHMFKVDLNGYFCFKFEFLYTVRNLINETENIKLKMGIKSTGYSVINKIYICICLCVYVLC